jgi:hypothetical protein
VAGTGGGGFTPPEYPAGSPQEAEQPRRPGLPLGAALGILAGVLAVGLVLVFTVGHPKSNGPGSLVALPGITSSARSTGPSPSASPSASTAGGTPARPTLAPTATSTTGAGGPGVDTSTGTAFYVGECVDTSASGSDFSVEQSACSGAQFKIIHAFPNESGKISADQSQCYAINGNDNEFENGNAADGYTLYCMNSLTGSYSPRRAEVSNCLDSAGAYEVDCTGTRAYWIVVGRLDDTTNTRSCSKFGSYDYSYYYTATPTFVLCVNRYHA